MGADGSRWVSRSSKPLRGTVGCRGWVRLPYASATDSGKTSCTPGCSNFISWAAGADSAEAEGQRARHHWSAAMRQRMGHTRTLLLARAPGPVFQTRNQEKSQYPQGSGCKDL